jgi:rhamnose utilization protein RhaD (predicted bifunctional aldolase and dehydrogenase)
LRLSLQSDLDSLIRLSACLGVNPLLVQAGTGNTSLKVDDVLWIKASGKWLANAAREETFVPVDLTSVRHSALRDEPCTVTHLSAYGSTLTSSIETAMHAVIPNAVTVHVHSVDAIAWAVRRDGPVHLENRLAGLPWQWIPYTRSGNPLAHAVLDAFRRAPDTRILVLANHGLVVCGDSCHEAEQLLSEVQNRIAIAPRPVPPPDLQTLCDAMIPELLDPTEWHVASRPVIHSLGTDPDSREILAGGILYPCQPIFLGQEIPVVSEQPRNSPFRIIDGAGTLVSNHISTSELEILTGLAEVVRRIDRSAPMRYLTAGELVALLTIDAPNYLSAAAQC